MTLPQPTYAKPLWRTDTYFSTALQNYFWNSIISLLKALNYVELKVQEISALTLFADELFEEKPVININSDNNL